MLLFEKFDIESEALLQVELKNAPSEMLLKRTLLHSGRLKLKTE
jgi:hypothetical protein